MSVDIPCLVLLLVFLWAIGVAVTENPPGLSEIDRKLRRYLRIAVGIIFVTMMADQLINGPARKEKEIKWMEKHGYNDEQIAQALQDEAGDPPDSMN